jgi:NAD(P)H-dependent FMN reductase
LKIGIISGSQRAPSQSAKVAQYCRTVLTQELGVADTFLCDLGAEPLPWCEEEEPRPAEAQDPQIRALSTELHSCEGFVVVTPEWGGMAPASLKNFFLWCNGQELSHKPGLIVSVARRLGGSYPVVELRMSSYKNTQICWIPEHVIVRHVESMLNSPEPSGDDEVLLRQRLQYGLSVLLEYARALCDVRASGVIDARRYRWGM